jgi:hypothetical protein
MWPYREQNMVLIKWKGLDTHLSAHSLIKCTRPDSSHFESICWDKVEQYREQTMVLIKWKGLDTHLSAHSLIDCTRPDLFDILSSVSSSRYWEGSGSEPYREQTDIAIFKLFP